MVHIFIQQFKHFRLINENHEYSPNVPYEIIFRQQELIMFSNVGNMI